MAPEQHKAARSLSDRLEACGCAAGPDDFRDTVQELKAAMFPAWTDEELLFHPEDARALAVAVRRRCGCQAIPDDLVLRTLVNVRKKCKSTEEESEG